jgi:hypothetical protein
MPLFQPPKPTLARSPHSPAMRLALNVRCQDLRRPVCPWTTCTPQLLPLGFEAGLSAPWLHGTRLARMPSAYSPPARVGLGYRDDRGVRDVVGARGAHTAMLP